MKRREVAVNNKGLPIISKNIRIRCPKDFKIGNYSIIDDFCYFSTKVRVGRCSHIASGCSIAGGRDRQFILGDYSSLSSGVKVWCASDDFTNDVVALIPDEIGEIKNNFIKGDITIASLTAVGSNSVIMPRNNIPEGTVIGALSFVPVGFKFKPWSVYAGIPIKYLGPRNKKNVLNQIEIVKRYFRT
ncbi:MAG: hypothetical protein PHO42_04685 [Candidatus Omnitrophica bacterium]|nr:hypothetical protein [Candidatus Omnitrophota bacterium]